MTVTNESKNLIYSPSCKPHISVGHSLLGIEGQLRESVENQKEVKTMNDTLSKVKVYETLDYAKFKVLNGNRPLKKAHVKLLKGSISEHGDLGPPIIVNEKFEMIDGQHRKKALEELMLPVLYIKKSGFGIKEVHVSNTNRKNWSMSEFMNCYADLGMKDYIRYRDFYHKFGFPQSTTLTIVQGYLAGGGDKYRTMGTEAFRKGLFIFKNPEEAEDRAEKILMLKDIYYGYKKGLFVQAMIRLFRFEDYNHAEFVSKLRQNMDKLLIEPNTVNGYLRIFEDIYNYRRQGKKISFFQDLKIRNAK